MLMLTCDAGVVVIIRVVVSAVMLISLLPAGDGLDVAEIGQRFLSLKRKNKTRDVNK